MPDIYGSYLLCSNQSDYDGSIGPFYLTFDVLYNITQSYLFSYAFFNNMNYDTNSNKWVVTVEGYYNIMFNCQFYNKSNRSGSDVYSFISLNSDDLFRRCYTTILYTSNQSINLDINIPCLYLKIDDILQFGINLYSSPNRIYVTDSYLNILLLKEV